MIFSMGGFSGKFFGGISGLLLESDGRYFHLTGEDICDQELQC